MEICITLIYNKTHVEINLKFENIQLTITYLKPPKSQDLISKKNTHKPNLRLRLKFKKYRGEREREIISVRCSYDRFGWNLCFSKYLPQCH